jgi:phospholipase/lecithinase/hemolysin
VRQRVIDFNTAFATTLLSRIRTNCPGLTVQVPDLFTLLDNILGRSADYGFTNALYNGQPIDALEDPLLTDKSLNGRGTNYIFWDTTDPTAKAHAVIADYVQQLLSPPWINSITHLSGSNRLGMVNLPIGRAGFVEGSAGFSGWTNVAGITSTNLTQTILLPAPATGPPGFYRLRFPFAWTWP